MCVFVCSRLVVVWVVFGVFEFYEVGGVVLYDKKTIIQDLLTSLILQ